MPSPQQRKLSAKAMENPTWVRCIYAKRASGFVSFGPSDEELAKPDGVSMKTDRYDSKIQAAVKAYNHAVETNNTRRWRYWFRIIDQLGVQQFRHMGFQKLLSGLPYHGFKCGCTDCEE